MRCVGPESSLRGEHCGNYGNSVQGHTKHSPVFRAEAQKERAGCPATEVLLVQSLAAPSYVVTRCL